jgi:DNA-binding NarL/FixJ family response regulator
LLVYEADGRLAACLRSVAEEHGWTLREPKRLETVLSQIDRPGLCLLVMRTGRDLEREFTLLERVRELHQEVAVIVICDNEHPRLLGLAWDLGATFVLPSEQSNERLLELVNALLSGE